MDTAASIPFAGSQLHGKSRHVCAFFHSDDEEYRVLLPFIKDGFERGDRAVHVVDPARRADHVRRLEGAGIDSTAAQRTGQLDLRSQAETYLRDGRFDEERMIQMFEQFASGSVRKAFPVSRIVCHMDWAGEDPSHRATCRSCRCGWGSARTSASSSRPRRARSFPTRRTGPC